MFDMAKPRKARRAKQRVVVTPVDPMTRAVALMGVRRLLTCERVTLKPTNDQAVGYW
jgi:hypothetical protein